MASKVVVTFEVDNKGAIKSVKQFRGELNEVPKAANKASSGVKGLKDNVNTLKAALAAAGITAAVWKLVDFARDVVMVGAKFETMAIQLRSLMESIEQGDAAMAWIKQFTKDTPFELEQVAQAFVRMKAMGIDPTSGALQAVADAASYTGTGFEGLGRITLALGQAWTKNKLQGEELLQLMEAQVPAADMLGQALGVSTGEIYKMASAGKIGRDEIVLLIEEMQKMYAGASINQMKTFTGMWSNLKDRITETYAELAEMGALEAAKMGVDALSKALNALGPLFDVIKSHKTEIYMLIHFVSTLASARVDNFANAMSKIANSMNQMMASLRLVSTEKMSPESTLFMIRLLEANGIKIANSINMVASHARTTADEIDKLKEKLGGGGGAGSGGGDNLSDAFLTAGNRTNEYLTILWATEYGLRQATETADEYFKIMSNSGGMQNIYDAWTDNAWVWAGDTEEVFDYVSGTFSDLLGKGFMGELESFADLWDAVWQDLAKSMVGAIGNAFEKLFSGESDWLSGFDSTAAKIGSVLGGIGMVAQSYQSGGGGWRGALSGAMGGAMAGMPWAVATGGLSVIAGAIIGGVIGAIGQAAESPETFVMQLGLDTGQMLTRGHQGIGPEMRELWIKQQQGIMRSYIKSYREILRMFEDQSLFDLIGQTPTFNTTGWQGIGANDLAKYLEQEFWPTAFMNMFRDAISAGLEGFGVTTSTIDQLWTELEDLPGADRMGALSTYVSGLVNLSNLMADMDWNAILDAVGMDSMQQFMYGVEGVTAAIESLMFAMDDMSLLERAEQAQQIEDLITQVRQAEIQYLQQLDSLQKSINASISSQIEQFNIGGMTGPQQNVYYQQRIREIMATLSGGGVTSPEQLQQLMADLQRYISALAGNLGDTLYAPMSPWDDQTWAQYLSDILMQAQGYSDEYFEAFRTEIREVNERLIETLEELILALTDFGEAAGGEVGAGGGGGGGGPNPVVVEPQVNVYLEGSIAALRPLIRAEVRDAMGGGAYPVS